MEVFYIIIFLFAFCFVTTLIVYGCYEVLRRIRSIKKHYDELVIYCNHVNRENFYNKALKQTLISEMLQFPNIDYIDIAKNNYNCFTEKMLDLLECYNLRKKEAEKRFDDVRKLCGKLRHMSKKIKMSNIIVFFVTGAISCLIFYKYFSVVMGKRNTFVYF